MRVAKFNITLILLSSLFISLCFHSCQNDDEYKTYPEPEIQFINDSGFIYEDTTLLLSDMIKIGIVAKSKSDVELTHFNYTIIEDDTNITSIDSGIYTQEFQYKLDISKGIAYQERWEFYVRDRDGRESNVFGITLTKDSASIFGNIVHIPSLSFGAQSNNEYNGFYSLSELTQYNLSEAYNNQDIINMLYFYDFLDGDENTISSPGANIDESVFPGSQGLQNWQTRNTTRFIEQTAISVVEFDACTNDSLILANTFSFSSGKRKSKNLAPGKIFAFVTENEIYRGLFKVIDVQGLDEGSVEIEIKMQEQK